MAQTKKLYRLPKQGQIAGVAAGLAEYLELDVTLLRLIFVVLVFATGGFMIVIYAIMALVLPTPDSEIVSKDSAVSSLSQNASTLSRELQDSKGVLRLRNYVGAGLVIIGAWLLLEQIFPDFWDLRWDLIWPAMLVVAGLLVITRGRK